MSKSDLTEKCFSVVPNPLAKCSQVLPAKDKAERTNAYRKAFAYPQRLRVRGSSDLAVSRDPRGTFPVRAEWGQAGRKARTQPPTLLRSSWVSWLPVGAPAAW